jgi:exopolysaccharide biosynthesis polyprenyl glycosylphosphotransferase
MSRLPSARTIAVFDCASILAALIGSGLFRDPAAGTIAPLDAAAVASMFVLLWFAVAAHIGVYRVAPQHNILLALRRTLDAWALTWGVGGIVAITTVASHDFSVWIVMGLGCVLLVTGRCLVAATPWLWSQARIRAVVIGTHPTGNEMPRADNEQALHLVGVVPFSTEHTATARLPALGTVPELGRLLVEHDIDVAVVSPSDAAITGEVRAAFRACRDQGVTVHYFPSLLDVDHERVRITWGAGADGIDVAAVTSPRRSLELGIKCAIDYVGASFGVAVLLPVLALCAAGVKLTSRGPVFFRQTRVGAGGRLFECLKFRTMRVGAHTQQELLRASSTQDGPAFKMPADPRVTPIGRLLRKFSLDELPQLFNVLRGEMSLVGPRPPIPTEVDRYEWWQRRRVSVKPGLTCLWQVYGRNRVSFRRWVEMDLFYIDNWSLWMDLKLIAHTFLVVLRGTGM